MKKSKTLAIACDHAGYETKQHILSFLKEQKFEVKDFGTFSNESTDYPDYIHPLAKAIENEEYNTGIVLCGSGNGVNMTVNKYQGIRSALCWKKEIAILARKHNDANVCALPARFLNFKEALEIVDVFLSTDFDGGRHQRRIEKIPKK